MNVEITAPAKVNLFLNVLGKRSDGFHDIRSLLVPVSLFDRIWIETRAGDVETVMKSGIAKLGGLPWPAARTSSQNNLATRAGLALKELTGYREGALITIEKNIPVSAGLGGGSSDAAATLRGLNAAWRTGLSVESLMRLGDALGCDVPALVHGGIVLAEGRGELVSPLAERPARPLWMVLVNPGIEVSTADIYSRHQPDLTFEGADHKLKEVLKGLNEGNVETVGRGLFNDLEKTAFRKYPLLMLIKNELEKAGAAGVLLSGSGATIMALARDRDHGIELESRARMAIRCPVWTCVVAAAC